MQIFEYPYIIIIILAISFIILGAVGVYFAVQGIRAAQDTEETDFSTVSKLESDFNKLGNNRANCSLIYIHAALDNARSLYSDSVASEIFSEIQSVFLKTFSDDETSSIALYDRNNFIALNQRNINEAKENIENCRHKIHECLVKYEAVNIVNIRFGSYSAIASQVSFDDAINRAKQACMLAEHESNGYVEWNSSAGNALEKKIKIENNIEKEINNNNFFLEYQPVVDAASKKIVGAEVLSRLNSEEDGILTAGTFLSAVDSVGLNDKFDYYIFEKNCKWISNNRSQREKYLYTINFSRTTLCEPQFASKIISIIDKYNLKYTTLAIEILEDKNIVGEAGNRMRENLLLLKKKGIVILLDDFGSGFTTFEDLQNLSIDIVKIDKSITQKSDTETGFLILKNVVRTAKDIGLKTVCEGIETPMQEAAAIEAGCDMLQGFYYYKPMQVAQLEKIFEFGTN